MRKIIHFLFGTFAGWLLTVSISALAIIGGGVAIHTHSSGASGGTILGGVSYTAAPASTAACVAGYTRVGPNLCMASSDKSATTLTTGCVNIATPTGAAKAVIWDLSLTPQGQNVATAIESVIVTFNGNDSGCTVITRQASATAREQVAVTAGQTVISVQAEITVPVIGGSNFVQKSPLSNGAATITPRGYWD